MAIYEIIVEECEDLSKAIAIVRKYSELSITDIRTKINNRSAVIKIDSSENHSEMDVYEGHVYEHNRFFKAVTSLQRLNVKLKFRYRASKDWDVEQGNIEMMKNLPIDRKMSLNEKIFRLNFRFLDKRLVRSGFCLPPPASERIRYASAPNIYQD